MAKGVDINIDYAVAATLKKHPEFAPFLPSIIYKNIYCGINPVNFTSDVRDCINEVEQVDFLYYLLNEAIIIYTSAKGIIDESDDVIESENLSRHFPMFEHIKKAIAILKEKSNNVIFYYLCNRTELFELIEAISLTIFKKRWYAAHVNSDIRENFHNRLIIVADKNPESKSLRRMLNKETNIIRKIKNLELNYEAINICQREIMLGNQVKKAHNEYAIGDLYASQDIGKKRKNQEDAVLIQEHVENPNLKILAIADGMGGHNYGEVASTFVLSRISEWFNTISPDFFDYPEQLQQLFDKELMKISKELYHHLGSSKKNLVGGTTFSGAIITKNKTIISSVGDSRIYLLSGNDLTLVTEDESYVWKKLIEEKKKENQPVTTEDIDDLRITPHNNIILRCIGDKELEYVQSRLIDNEDYDKLLLFSDGITDILSHEEIKFISSTTSPEDLTQVFIEQALSHGVTKKESGIDHKIEIVAPGKDNLSVAAYIRRSS